MTAVQPIILLRVNICGGLLVLWQGCWRKGGGLTAAIGRVEDMVAFEGLVVVCFGGLGG